MRKRARGRDGSARAQVENTEVFLLTIEGIKQIQTSYTHIYEDMQLVGIQRLKNHTVIIKREIELAKKIGLENEESLNISEERDQVSELKDGPIEDIFAEIKEKLVYPS